MVLVKVRNGSATKAEAVNEGSSGRTIEVEAVESSYSHPKLVQELMEWVISRKRYNQLKEPEREIVATLQGPNFTFSTSSPINTIESPLVPGPSLRLTRFLAKQYIREVLATAGSGSKLESGWVRNGGNDFEMMNE